MFGVGDGIGSTLSLHSNTAPAVPVSRSVRFDLLASVLGAALIARICGVQLQRRSSGQSRLE